MLYAAKCYWPGVSQSELEQVATRAAEPSSLATFEDVAYLGSLLFADDDLVLCLFEGPSRAAVKQASEHAGIPCERLMNSIWVRPDPRATPHAETSRQNDAQQPGEAEIWRLRKNS
jgi:hypothetical protein